MSLFYVGRRRAGKSRAFINVSVVLALLFSFLTVVLAVQTTPASAGGPVPRLVKLLGSNSYQDYNDSENRLDFVIAVPTGQTPTQVRIDQDPNGALANTLSLVAGPSINNDYQIVSTTTIGAVDYLAISIRSDDNFNYGDSCTVHSLTYAVRVTVPAGVINFSEPVTQYPTNPLCIGTGRPVARTTWDNTWGSPDGNSQDGFGAVIPAGVLSGAKVIIDADNPNFQNAAGQADCGVTNSVYYQWVKPDGSPTLLTPTPVSVATTAHHFSTGNALRQAITAGFPSTFDFTADGPGYYRLLAWPQATSVPAGVGCAGRSWDQTQISQGWQVGSVWYNFTATQPAPPVINAPVDGSFTNNTTPTITGTGTAGDTVTVTEGGTTLCTATVTAGGTWSCTSSALTNGLHTISALQTDTDGIDSNPSANDAFTVDTVAPLAPTITAPANGSSTNNPSPNITGTGEPAATVTVKDEGGATVCTATVLAGGTWQCTPAASFSLGAHTVTSSQTDRAGNLSPNSTTNAFTVTTPVFTQTKTADRASYIVGQPITYTVTVSKTTGDVFATGEIVEKRIVREDIARALRADGLATTIGGVFNSFPYTCFAENVGLVRLTRIKSRWVVATAGLIMIVVGLLPKAGAIVASVPHPVLGGAAIAMFATVAVVGIQTLSRVDFHDHRNIVIVGTSLGLAMLVTAQPGVSHAVPKWAEIILGSGITLGSITAIVLNFVFHHIGKDFGPGVAGVPGEGVVRLDQVNEMSREEFVATFGRLFQGPAWVTERAYEQRPFADTHALRKSFQEALFSAARTEQQDLMSFYPDLGADSVADGEQGENSVRDQSSIGLTRLNDEDHAAFGALASAYREQFGIPLIVCVREVEKLGQILSAGWTRMENSQAQEHATALIEIAKIANHRFEDLVAGANPIATARTQRFGQLT